MQQEKLLVKPKMISDLVATIAILDGMIKLLEARLEQLEND